MLWTHLMLHPDNQRRLIEHQVRFVPGRILVAVASGGLD